MTFNYDVIVVGAGHAGCEAAAAAAATPVPGGVGSVTTAVLCRHLAEAAMRKYGAEQAQN